MTDTLFAVGDRVAFSQFPGWSFGTVAEVRVEACCTSYRVAWDDGFRDDAKDPFYSDAELTDAAVVEA